MTTKKKPDIAALFPSGFGAADGVPTGAVDPIMITTMILPLSEIELYDQNPRTTLGDSYAQIKESIQRTGLAQPLLISRRPGAKKYVVYKGGNSRLQILRELLADTGEARFAHVRCDFQPWEGEVTALVGAISENVMRSPMRFVEIALAVARVKTMMEESSGKNLTLEQLLLVLGKEGLPIRGGKGYLSKLLLAAEYNRYLPLALADAAGKDAVEKLRRVEKAGFQVWQFHACGDDADIFRDEVFGPAVATTDKSANWTAAGIEGVVVDALLAAGIAEDDVMRNLEEAYDKRELTQAVVLEKEVEKEVGARVEWRASQRVEPLEEYQTEVGQAVVGRSKEVIGSSSGAVLVKSGAGDRVEVQEPLILQDVWREEGNVDVPPQEMDETKGVVDTQWVDDQWGARVIALIRNISGVVQGDDLSELAGWCKQLIALLQNKNTGVV